MIHSTRQTNDTAMNSREPDSEHEKLRTMEGESREGLQEMVVIIEGLPCYVDEDQEPMAMVSGEGNGGGSSAVVYNCIYNRDFPMCFHVHHARLMRI